MARLAEVLGVPFMPSQRYVFDVGCEVLADGRWAYPLVEVSFPRQAGKTTGWGTAMEHRAMTLPRARCWFTMQTRLDATDWLVNEHAPSLAGLGGNFRLRRGAGYEAVQWFASGGLMRPFSPQPEALHGKTSDLVVIDECWAFDLERGRALDQAIAPTQATKAGRGQVWKFSTAGDDSSGWWLSSVQAGRRAVESGRREGRAYFEWSCPDGLDPCDESSWPLFHPAFGRTIDVAAMRAALELLGPEEFARAYGNRWAHTSGRVIPAEVWAAGADEAQVLPAVGGLALGFDVAVDRSDASIVAAWRDGAGVARVEVADHGPAAGWVAGRLVELVGRWRPVAVGYDQAGPALDVADEAARLGVELAPLKAREYAAACAGLLEALCAEPPGLRYRPHPALDDAAQAAVRRALGDAWAWARRSSSVSLSALTAATVALWAYDHARQPDRPFRVL